MVNLGANGIFPAIIKLADSYKSHQRLFNISGLNTSKLHICQSGFHYFYVTDSLDNTFKIVQSDDWFQKDKHDLGGVIGAVIGVSNIEKSIEFYQTILGLDTILYDTKINENNHNFSKVELHKGTTGKDTFNKLLGNVTSKLIQNLD
jgi:hypothetical protein